jgi:chromosome segregation ATPase
MASHVELNPDDNVLGLSLGMKAMRLALTQKTHKVGTVRIPTGGDTDVIIGDGAQDGANRIDQDGNQLPLVDTSEIEQGVQQAQKDADAAAAKADEAIKQGEQIRQDAQAGIDDARKQAQAAADKADKVRSDLQAEVDANKKATDTAIAAVDAKADKTQSDLTQQVDAVKSEMDTAVKAAQSSADKAQTAADKAQESADKANASTVDLDKSIQAVDAKAVAAKQAAAEAQSKAENVASDLDSANTVIEQHTTELGELTTKVSNAVTKADSALSVSTEAKQTATEASTTASSAYKDSQTALTQSTSATQTATAAKTTAESASKTATDSLKQSSSAVQTANQISTTLKTEYQTKADADKLYATQSSLKQTSDSITASVSKTYATKDALTALQNVADNAIESWRGTGVPTLTNKPASDWTTDAEKKKHSGDLYYDKATGKAYRFGSDDGKTYTWELNQDSDVTKALSDASKAQTSANNAQTSANAANTAAGKAQTTANTAANNAATAKNAADAAQSSANKAQGDVDKLKVDIPATYATKSSLTQTAESITANVESVKSTANSAVTAASKAQQTADGISVNLSKNYQTKSQADALYATQANLKATSESISAEVTKAQGTADGAVTAASKAQQTADAVTLNLSKNYQTKAQADAVYATQTSLKATSDSLTASINSTAKTAQSAVDKATNLEANLNGFKTTVSQTYTTKTDFNSLQIGGTNLCPKSNPYNIDLSNAVKDPSTGMITGTVPTNANATWGAGVTPGAATHLKTPYGRRCVLSFDVWSEIAATVVVDINNMPESVAAWNGNDNDGWRGGVQPTTNGVGACSIPAKQWIRLWVTYSNTSAKNTGKVDIFDQSHIGLRPASAAYQVKFKDFKFELGSRPTEYSPCPSDLQPAGDYSTKSELSQTADAIKAQVSEASKTASGAMSKATTLEQTANSLSSTITAQGKTLEATTKTANTAKATADSNTTAISQVKTTADGAVNRVSSLEQNLNGFKTTVAKTYQDKAGMSNYATNSALKQTSNNITSQVTAVSKTASGAMSKATSLEQTASGLSTKITEQGKTLDATVKTANEAKSTADSNKTAISQVSTTANNALSKTSSLEQNLSGFKTSVANTYTTKADFNNLTIGGTNLLLNTSGVFVGHPSASGVNANAGWLPRLVDGLTYSTLPAGTYQLRFEVMTDTEVGSYAVQWADTPWVISSFSLSKGVWKTLTYTIVKPDGATGKARGFMLRTDNVPTSATIRVRRAKLERGSRPTDWSPAPQDLQAAGDYATNSSLTQTASQIRSEVAEKYQSKSGMSSYATTSALTQKANEITGKVQEVAKTAQGNTTTISQVSQKADKINTTLSQKIDGKADVSRVSSLEQSLSGFKTSVAQSYQPKGDYPTKTEMQSQISQTASSIKNEVSQTYATQADFNNLSVGGTNLLVKSDFIKSYINTDGGLPIYPNAGPSDSTYVGYTSSKKPIAVSANTVYALTAYDTMPDSTYYTGRISQFDSNNKFIGYAVSSISLRKTGYLTFRTAANAAYVYVGIYCFPKYKWKLEKGTKPTDWSPAPEDLQPAGDYAVKSYVDQTSKSVALGVVQSYKGSDGSGLATKSDITAAKDSITSSVSSTYATKTGVTQEISSKITQNNNSLDVKFSTKVETQNAQNKADTADSHASDAQSRVGALEDCISITSAGVRAGHQANGVFDAISALVNTDGSFDLLDKDGNLLTRINRHRFQVTGDDGTGSGYLSLSQDGINITVQPTADASETYHIQVGKSGVGITAPDRSSIECSASGGLNIETVKYGKIAIGSGGLQFTNDQGWGLKLSAAGWSIKWAGNHTLATGPKAGALYIDGHEIVTR